MISAVSISTDSDELLHELTRGKTGDPLYDTILTDYYTKLMEKRSVIVKHLTQLDDVHQTEAYQLIYMYHLKNNSSILESPYGTREDESKVYCDALRFPAGLLELLRCYLQHVERDK